MESMTRFALYWAPPQDDPLAKFGAVWLGHDPGGSAGVHRERLGLEPAFVDTITAEPWRYGLHATLKAPFRLRAGVSVPQLGQTIASLAAGCRVVATPPLQLTLVKGFLALCPSGPAPQLNALADRCVTELDEFRAELTPRERARRNPAKLTPQQQEYLETWGYPYVLSEFRFHITLTGRLAEAERTLAEPALRQAVASFCRQPLVVSELALFGDPGNRQPFRLLQRFALAAPPAEAPAST